MLIFLRHDSGRESTMTSGISTHAIPAVSGPDPAGTSGSFEALRLNPGSKSTFDRQPGSKHHQLNYLETSHMWTKPEFTEMRFGFEVTMYIANR